MADADRTEGPPFLFDGVTARVFPLRAHAHALQRLCDLYLNLYPDQICFRPTAPYVMLTLLNYGRMSYASETAAHYGWVSQNEVYFGVPLDWKRRTTTGWTTGAGVVAPFIFVDQGWSIETGREVYGWPKQPCEFQREVNTWASSSPAARENLLTLATDTFVTPYASERPTSVPLVEIDRLAPLSLGPALWQSPLSIENPWWGMMTMMRESMRAWSPTGLSDVGMYVPLLMQSMRLLYGGPSPEFYTANLKQVRSLEDPSVASYQAITMAPMQLTALHRAGMLGEGRILLGDPTGGYRVRVQRHPLFPIIETLGLLVSEEEQHSDARDVAIRGYTAGVAGNTRLERFPEGLTSSDDIEHGVATLAPLFPFWLEADLKYGCGETITWRAPQLNDGAWNTRVPLGALRGVGAGGGGGAGGVGGVGAGRSDTVGTAGANAGDDPGAAWAPGALLGAWRSRTGGGAASGGSGAGSAGAGAGGGVADATGDAASDDPQFGGKSGLFDPTWGARALPAPPYFYPQLTMRFLALQATDALAGVIADLQLPPEAGSFQQGPPLILMMITTSEEMGAASNSAGWWWKRQVSFYAPGLWSYRGRTRPALMALVTFADSELAAVTAREIGPEVIASALYAPPDSWLDYAGPAADRRLLWVATNVLPALDVDAETKQRIVLELLALNPHHASPAAAPTGSAASGTSSAAADPAAPVSPTAPPAAAAGASAIASELIAIEGEAGMPMCIVARRRIRDAGDTGAYAYEEWFTQNLVAHPPSAEHHGVRVSATGLELRIHQYPDKLDLIGRLALAVGNRELSKSQRPGRGWEGATVNVIATSFAWATLSVTQECNTSLAVRRHGGDWQAQHTGGPGDAGGIVAIDAEGAGVGAATAADITSADAQDASGARPVRLKSPPPRQATEPRPEAAPGPFEQLLARFAARVTMPHD